MSRPHRVVWGEGMMLTPQHFQQAERFAEHQRSALLRSVHAHPWGLVQWRIDTAALAGGELIVEECRGIFPGGLFFDAPHCDPLPPRRRITAELAPIAGRTGVWLAMPRPAGNGLVFAASEETRTPYGIEAAEIADNSRAGADRDIEVGTPRLRVLFDQEPLDEFEAIQIGELKVSEGGVYELDDGFVPPVLAVRAAPALSRLLRRLLEMASTKSEELRGQQRKSGGFAEAVSFWLLHTVNSYIPVLSHYYHAERVHPEQLHVALAQFAGELCTFARDVNPAQLPRYRHDDLRGAFAPLDEHLRRLLGEVAPSRCIPIPLEKKSETLFEARIADDTMLAEAQFFLAVGADKEGDWIAREVPKQVRLSSSERLTMLMQYAIPGLELLHVANPPADVPIQQGRVYFRLQKAGEHWDAIAGSHGLSCHVPPVFPALRLELMAVKES